MPSKAKFDLVHSDLWGPAPIPSPAGFTYYILFLDDYSRYVWLYPLKRKSDSFAAFLHFVTVVQTQFNNNIRSLQSDNGGEYVRIHQECHRLGITSRYSCPYTSAQNGMAERKHRHVVETGLTLLAHASMPLTYWWDAFLAAAHLINCLPTSVLNGKSPVELLFNKKFDVSLLRSFGCACYPCLRPYQRHKFEFHSERCVHLGFSPIHKGYKCLTADGRMYISRDVKFNRLTSLFQQASAL